MAQITFNKDGITVSTALFKVVRGEQQTTFWSRW